MVITVAQLSLTSLRGPNHEILLRMLRSQGAIDMAFFPQVMDPSEAIQRRGISSHLLAGAMAPNGEYLFRPGLEPARSQMQDNVVSSIPECSKQTKHLDELRYSSMAVFVESCEEHRQRLFRKAFKITRNYQDAEDAVQETMLCAFNKLDTFKGKSAFGTWLTSILINNCLSELRRRRRRNHVSLDETREGEASWLDVLADNRESSESGFLRKERSERLQLAVQRLPPDLRDAVSDRLRGTPLKDIAVGRGTTETAIKCRLMRARVALKRGALA